MEPALGRREYDADAGLQAERDRAATEPAVGRREHNLFFWLKRLVTSQPQWSPRSDGGNTLQDAVTPLDTWLPQWIPPPTGGSTSVENVEEGWGLIAAMEPAIGRREHRSSPMST